MFRHLILAAIIVLATLLSDNWLQQHCTELLSSHAKVRSVNFILTDGHLAHLFVFAGAAVWAMCSILLYLLLAFRQRPIKQGPTGLPDVGLFPEMLSTLFGMSLLCIALAAGLGAVFEFLGHGFENPNYTVSSLFRGFGPEMFLDISVVVITLLSWWLSPPPGGWWCTEQPELL